MELRSIFQRKWLWFQPTVGWWFSFGVHVHIAPPHVHLDLHLPLVIVFIGNHGMQEFLEEGHCGCYHSTSYTK